MAAFQGEGMNDSSAKAEVGRVAGNGDTSLWLQCPSGPAAAEGEVIPTGFQDHHA